MMLAVVPWCLKVLPASAGTPEPLDTEFLDYLLTYEGKDHNWTAVAEEKPVKKTVKAEAREATAAPAKVKEAPKP
jgi:hypothetical protein